MKLRNIQPADDAALAGIIRESLEKYHLALPGTAYFDPELDHLSRFYGASARRAYFVVVDEEGCVLGGCGVAEYVGNPQYAELQKLYLHTAAQGQGLSYALIERVYDFARRQGYQKLYLETHHALAAAVHVYERAGFQKLDGPIPGSQHGSMDIFFLRDIPPVDGQKSDSCSVAYGTIRRAGEGMEIERQFLVENLPGLPSVYEQLRQGYISLEPEIRIRQIGTENFSLTVKRGSGLVRQEWETEITVQEFINLRQRLEPGTLMIEKRRYSIPLPDGLVAELHVHERHLIGLNYVEVEFASAEAAEAFQPPAWFGREITEDARFSYGTLAKRDGIEILRSAMAIK